MFVLWLVMAPISPVSCQSIVVTMWYKVPILLRFLCRAAETDDAKRCLSHCVKEQFVLASFLVLLSLCQNVFVVIVIHEHVIQIFQLFISVLWCIILIIQYWLVDLC